MKDQYKAGDEIEVRAAVKIPANATGDEVRAWLRFELGNNGSLPLENPLADYDLESYVVRV